MSVSSALRFCRGSASRVLPVLTDACLGPQALRASPRLGFLFGAAGNCRGGGGLCCSPLSNYPTNSDEKNTFIVAASLTV